MAKTRRVYKGNAVSTTISGGLSAGATSCTIAANTGWPTTAPFYCVVDPGLSSEEKILVTAISGTTLSTITRGQDDTTDQTHAAGCTIYPVFTAKDADEANELASMWTTKGDLVTHGASTFATVNVGSNDTVLIADSAQTNGLKWGQVATAGIADSAVTSAKIADGTIVNADVSASAAIVDTKLNTISTANKVALTALDVDGGTDIGVGLADADLLIVDQGAAGANRKSALSRVATWLFAKVSGDATATSAGVVTLANNAVTTAKITDANVTTAKIADLNVTTGKIADSAVTQAKIADGAVTVAKFGTGILPVTTVTATGSLPAGTDGQVAYVNSNDSSEGLYTYNGTAWRKGPGWNAPWGVVNVTSNTTTDSAIGTTEKVTITSASFTAVANRNYRLSYYDPYLTNSVPDNTVARIRLTDTGGTLYRDLTVSLFANTVNTSVVTTLSAGSTVIVATLQAASGTTTATRNSSSPAQLVIEDIGPSGAPS